MKKIVFYPILLSINPILLLLATNINDVPVAQLFPGILIAPIVAAILMWLLNKWLKDIHRAGFMVFLTIFWFYHYGTIHQWANAIHINSFSFGSHWIFFLVWTLGFILIASGWLWRRITSPETITMFFKFSRRDHYRFFNYSHHA